jgi:hypothetical protein
VITYDKWRDSVELQLSRYEAKISDQMESVFRGWQRYEQVAQEISSLKERARTCRYLLIVADSLLNAQHLDSTQSLAEQRGRDGQ